MTKVIRKFIRNNEGARYTLLPTIIVTPLLQVADYHTPGGVDAFMDTAFARSLYPVVGAIIAVRFWTWTAGIELYKRGTIV